MMIFKIFRLEEWETLQKKGVTAGAPIDVADGYIHFSTAEQTAETAAKHFAGIDTLFLIAVDATTLGTALKWEVSRGGALFPHLYRKMTLEDVAWHAAMPLRDGAHILPDRMKESSNDLLR